ncbi:MAG: hypothetical protein FWE12_05505 [Oscillospiraceae bacterium]|nr:hypothetical protein [Oscillospiraceae bacterium]
MDCVSKKHPLSAYLKFFLLPLIGIVAFFVNIPLPSYTIVGATVAENSTILVNHLTSFLRALLWNGNIRVMPYIVLAISVYGLVDLYVRRKKHFSNTVNKVFAVIKMIGVVFVFFAVFHFGPEVMHEPRALLGGRGISAFVMNSILISITISIPLAAIFLPFLLNYGLVEFAGVLVRPIMRPVYRLPGRSAVILVTALLGNFSVGHIAVNGQYEEGHMTERESVAICTSFCNPSIAFMLVLAINTGMMAHWNAFFWSVFLITLIVSFIGVRIFPLSRIPDSYAPGITPHPETVYKHKILQSAFGEALCTAETSQNPFQAIAQILKATFAILAAIIMGAGFSTSVGMLLYFYTPIFEWIGVIFHPILWLVQIPAAEVNMAATGAAISLLEVTIPSLLVSSIDQWSVHIRYMMAVIPLTSVIFLGSFVPSLLSQNIPVKFWHLLVIWFERMVMSIFFAGIFSLILFGIPS